MPGDEMRDRVEKMVLSLSNARRIHSMYGEDHKITKEIIDKLYEELNSLLSETEEVTIGVIGDEMAFEKEPFYEISKKIRNFIDFLKETDAVKISFTRGLTKNELAEFIGILSLKPKQMEKDRGLLKIFESSDIRNIAIGKIGFRKDKQELTDENIKDLARKSYQEGLSFLTETLDNISKNQPINIKSARKFVSTIVSNLLKNKSLLLILTSTKSHDESTFVHDINVAIFTLLQAEALGLRQDYLGDIGVAALLHDAGKLAVSGDILRKKGKLDQEELKTIRSHPVDGAKILLESPGVSTIAALAAFEHHIQYDKEGYPKRPFDRDPNLISMMVTIADYYDAVRSRRYYREEMAPEKTYEDMIKLSGKLFHPDLLENFFNIIGVYPPGTLVELDTKEIGLVVRTSIVDIRHPQVEILYGAKGEKVDNPFIVNLLEKDKKGDYKRNIVKSILASDKIKVPTKYL